MGLRQAIRAASPAPLRRGVALTRRAIRDSGLGSARPRFAVRREMGGTWLPVVEIVQPIRMGAFGAGKLANIRLGARRISGVASAPGETLSLWRLVGRPSKAAGFQMGRSIRGDAVGGDIGGGLCQLSGILYELGLRGGLEIVERHPHSHDLYTEDERFTPLGLDATLVWPYKDLRLRNAASAPVLIRVTVEDSTIRAALLGAQAWAPAEIEIDRIDHGDVRDVEVRRRCDGASELVSRDRYRIWRAT